MNKLLLLIVVGFIGCTLHQVDTTPPAAPRGVRTVSLDNAVELQWLANTESDVRGYNIWWSGQYEGPYRLLGTTSNTDFVDGGAKNGTTYYYALSAFDYDGNESPLTKDVIYDTPRPEGFGVQLADYHLSPANAGYDFSTYSVGQYDDKFTDIFFGNTSGRLSLSVWSDTDIQDMGYTKDLDEISSAPVKGWSPSKSVEAIVGHTYVVWTWDDHYAKVRVRDVVANSVAFDWAYQVAKGNIELKRDTHAGQRDRTAAR